MYCDNNGRTIVWFPPISWLKEPLRRKIFSLFLFFIFIFFWFQEMSLKREIFANFLPQKIMTKYGIVSRYSLTFVSQKILACLQCDPFHL